MSQLLEVARNSVQPWEIDQMGHMNVQFYVDKASDGLAGLAIHLGLGPQNIRSHGAALYPKNLHARFLRERRPGAPFYLRAGVLEVDDDVITVYQEMVGSVSGTVAATFTMDVRLYDVHARQKLALPPRAADRARALSVEQPEHGRARGLDMSPPRRAPTLEEAEALGMVATYQACVKASHCNAHGWFVPSRFMGAVSDAIPNLLAQVRGEDRSQALRAGGAALEYRFVYHRYPRVNDVLALRSGLRNIGTKTYTWCHWLFDAETGKAVATSEAVAISLDLETRKAIPISETLRAELETLVIDGVSV